MKGLKRLQAGIHIVAVAGALALGAGPACAAEYEVRMPVEKTVRLAPPEDPAPAAKPDAAKTDAGKSGAPKTALGRAAEAAAVSAPKPAATPKAAAPVPKAAEAHAVKDAAPAPVTSAEKSPAKPAAKARKSAKPAQTAHALSADADALAEESGVLHVPSGAPIPVPAPAVTEAAPVPVKPLAKAAPAPKPEPKIDPKAGVLPPAPAGAPTPLVLPADGQWVGDVDLEFQADRIILRAATNAAVERVTWFNLANPAEPRKLAIDLRGPWRKKGNSVLRYDTGPVKAVVTGEHPDRLRLAVEFRDGAVAPQLEPVLESGPKGVSLTIPLAVRLAP